jgi:iron complex transport system ATP-binding protein
MILNAQSISLKRSGETILNKVNWQINQGEHWSLMGLNGSGKTTLLNIINGYIWPTEGQMTVLDQTFGKSDLRELRKRIGWVSSSFQEKLHSDNNALQIVLSGVFASIGLYDQPTNEEIEKATDLLIDFGCGNYIERPYQSLSQGERQKVLIARALMAEPELLILDEPCTGLDLFAREHLLDVINKVAKGDGGPTLIYVTHHVEEILPCFSHTLLLKKGEVYKSGPSSKVLTSEALTQFFGTALKVEERRERKWLSLV